MIVKLESKKYISSITCLFVKEKYSLCIIEEDYKELNKIIHFYSFLSRCLSFKSKKDGKDQVTIQSSTTPDPHMGK